MIPRHCDVTLVFAGLAVLVACESNLPLPARPAASPPAITKVTPEAAFAGARIVIEGTALGRDPDTTLVRFGETTAHPSAIAEDGSQLTVVVPDQTAPDTTSIVITTPEGSATFANFLFRGLGHLAHRRIAVERDLRPEPATALQIASGEGVLYHLPFLHQAAVVFSDGTQGLVPITPVLAMARIPGQDKVALLSTADDQLVLTFIEDADLLSIRFGDEPNSVEAARFTVDDLPFEPTLALDEDGKFAVIVSYDQTLLVDIAQAEAVQVDSGGDGAAWLGGTRFAIADDTLMRVHDLATPDEEAEYLFFEENDPPSFVSLAPMPDGRLVSGTIDGDVMILDPSTDPPSIVAGGGTRTLDVVSAVAVSADGTRIAAGVADANAVVVFAVGSHSLLPIATITLESPGSVTAEADGTFHVATMGGSTILAQVTGNVLGHVVLRNDLQSPVLRTARCGGSPTLVAEVAGTLFNRILHVNPATGTGVSCTTPIAAGLQLSALAAAAATGDLLALYGPDGAIHRLTADGSDGGSWTPPDALRVPSLSRVVEWPLSVSQDGRTALLTYNQRVASPDRDFVNSVGVLDLASFPPAAAVLTVGVSPDELLMGAWVAGPLLAIAGGSRVRLLDAEAARRGEERQVGELLLPEERIDGAAVRDGELWLFSHEGSSAYLRIVNGATGVATERRRMPSMSNARVHVAPGGRRIYWLGASFDGAQLQSVIVDATTGEMLGEEAPIALPAGTREYVIAPDGESIVAIDAAGDRLFVLE